MLNIVNNSLSRQTSTSTRTYSRADTPTPHTHTHVYIYIYIPTCLRLWNTPTVQLHKCKILRKRPPVGHTYWPLWFRWFPGRWAVRDPVVFIANNHQHSTLALDWPDRLSERIDRITRVAISTFCSDMTFPTLFFNLPSWQTNPQPYFI